jgi:hypothetical protein
MIPVLMTFKDGIEIYSVEHFVRNFKRHPDLVMPTRKDVG